MSKVQGEGDYASGKRYQDAQHRFAQQGPVEQAAREAADALAGPEGKDLEAARRASAEGKTGKAGTKAHIARRERNLDEGLDETYPASDPVSIHPGAD